MIHFYLFIFNEPEIALKYATNVDPYTYFRRGLIFEELKDYVQMEINLKLADGIKEANYILGKYYENQSNILKMNDQYEQGIKLNSKKCLVSLVNHYYLVRNYDKFNELLKYKISDEKINKYSFVVNTELKISSVFLGLF